LMMTKYLDLGLVAIEQKYLFGNGQKAGTKIVDERRTNTESLKS
jgi:hypothetical protein